MSGKSRCLPSLRRAGVDSFATVAANSAMASGVKRMVGAAGAKPCAIAKTSGSASSLNGSDDALVPIRRAGFEASRCNFAAPKRSWPWSVDRQSPDMLIWTAALSVAPPGLAPGAPSDVALMAVIDARLRAAAGLRFRLLPAQSRRPLATGLDRRRAPYRVNRVAMGASRPRNPASDPGAGAGRIGPTILVAMGGSDPQGLTLQVRRARWRRAGRRCSAFGLSSAAASERWPRHVSPRRIVTLAENYETVEGADDLSTEYANADLALCAFGVTAYELAAFGVPALYLGSLTPDHARSASAFAAGGHGRFAGWLRRSGVR